MNFIKPALLPLLLISIAFKAPAQQFNAEEYARHLGKTGTLCDTIKSLKIVNDTLALLYMGAAFPHQKYAIAVKGDKINLDWPNLQGKPVCVTGIFELYKNEPQIRVEQPDFIKVQ